MQSANLKEMEKRNKAFQQLYLLTANLENYTENLRAAKYKIKSVDK